MEILYIPVSRIPEKREPIERLPQGGLLWLDFARETDTGWAQQVEKLTGVIIHEGHVRDSFNPDHPSYYDATGEYEMIIFTSLAPDADPQQFTSRSSAFFLIEQTLVTVRPTDTRPGYRAEPDYAERRFPLHEPKMTNARSWDGREASSCAFWPAAFRVLA